MLALLSFHHCFCLSDHYQQLLQLPEQQLPNFVHKIAKPVLRCLTRDQLCEDFKEASDFLLHLIRGLLLSYLSL